MMTARIREFGPDDYPALVAVHNAAYPDDPTSALMQRFHDDHRDPQCRHRRWVAEAQGAVVGVGEYGQSAGMFHPQKFWVYLAVLPRCRRQGLGGALYEHVLAALAPFEPLSVRVGNVREDMTDSRRFLERRGFVESMRGWQSRLDLASFDPTPFTAVAEQVAAQGIEIRSMRELADDPDRDRRLWELEVALDQDVPNPEPPTPISFEHFSANIFESPNLVPDAFFVALDRGEYVGESTLWASQAIPDLEVGLTGVRRAYRRRGIALALKLRAIAWAQAHGYPGIRTWNEINNAGMLTINARLGFVRQPCWIEYVKTLREEP
jgi:GNAT superfamily N-acetyltransferase